MALSSTFRSRNSGSMAEFRVESLTYAHSRARIAWLRPARFLAGLRQQQHYHEMLHMTNFSLIRKALPPPPQIGCAHRPAPPVKIVYPRPWNLMLRSCQTHFSGSQKCLKSFIALVPMLLMINIGRESARLSYCYFSGKI